MRYGFGSLADPVGIGKAAALLGVVLVHPMKYIAQRFCSMTCLSHFQIQHHTQEFALVVIGNAALGNAIITVFFQPCVKARLLGRLRVVGRPPLEGGDLVDVGDEGRGDVEDLLGLARPGPAEGQLQTEVRPLEDALLRVGEEALEGLGHRPVLKGKGGVEVVE